MTLILDLPPGVEEALAREAAQQGTTPERLAVDGLRQLFPAADDAPPVEIGFNELKRLLPQIERISLTDQDLAAVALDGPKP